MKLLLKEIKFVRQEADRPFTFPYYGAFEAKLGSRQLRAEAIFSPAADWNNHTPSLQEIRVTIVDPGTQFTSSPLIQVQTYGIDSIDTDRFFTFVDNDYSSKSTKKAFDKAYAQAVEATQTLKS